MIDDRVYSAVVEYIVAAALESMVATGEGDLSYYNVEDYGNELIVELTILGSRKRVSIPVTDVASIVEVDEYLSGLARKHSGNVSRYVFAMRDKLRRNR